MTFLRGMVETACIAALFALACVAFLVAMLLSPYFFWKWKREEREEGR
jgi:uncharacterized Tic20 family protein